MAGIVGEHAVDAEPREPPELGAVVDGPRVDRQPGGVPRRAPSPRCTACAAGAARSRPSSCRPSRGAAAAAARRETGSASATSGRWRWSWRSANGSNDDTRIWSARPDVRGSPSRSPRRARPSRPTLRDLISTSISSSPSASSTSASVGTGSPPTRSARALGRRQLARSGPAGRRSRSSVVVVEHDDVAVGVEPDVELDAVGAGRARARRTRPSCSRARAPSRRGAPTRAAGPCVRRHRVARPSRPRCGTSRASGDVDMRGCHATR